MDRRLIEVALPRVRAHAHDQRAVVKTGGRANCPSDRGADTIAPVQARISPFAALAHEPTFPNHEGEWAPPEPFNPNVLERQRQVQKLHEVECKSFAFLERALNESTESHKLPLLYLETIRSPKTLTRVIDIVAHFIATKIPVAATQQRSAAFGLLHADINKIDDYGLNFLANREVARASAHWPTMAELSKPLPLSNQLAEHKARCDKLVRHFSANENLLASGLIRLAANLPGQIYTGTYRRSAYLTGAFSNATSHAAFKHALSKIAFIHEKGLRAKVIRAFSLKRPPDENGTLAAQLIEHFSRLSQPLAPGTACHYKDSIFEKTMKTRPHDHVQLFRELVSGLPYQGSAKLHLQLRNLLPRKDGAEIFAGEIVAAMAERLPPEDEIAAHADLCSITSVLDHQECRMTAIIALAECLPKGNEAIAYCQLRQIASGVSHEGYSKAIKSALDAVENRAVQNIREISQHLPAGFESGAYLGLRGCATSLENLNNIYIVGTTLNELEPRVVKTAIVALHQSPSATQAGIHAATRSLCRQLVCPENRLNLLEHLLRNIPADDSHNVFIELKNIAERIPGQQNHAVAYNALRKAEFTIAKNIIAHGSSMRSFHSNAQNELRRALTVLHSQPAKLEVILGIVDLVPGLEQSQALSALHSLSTIAAEFLDASGRILANRQIARVGTRIANSPNVQAFLASHTIGRPHSTPSLIS